MKYRVLVVDDEPDVREVIEAFLSPTYKVLTAGTAIEALEILRWDKVDVILTDLDMPQMHGLEFVKKLQEIAVTSPIIVLTGRGSRELERQTVAHASVEYLEKPFDGTELELAVEKAISLSQAASPVKKENPLAQVLLESLETKISKKLHNQLRIRCEAEGISIGTLIERSLTNYFKDVA